MTEPAGAARRGDPFPRERFGALVRRTPSYARLAWSLARDSKLAKGRRAAVLAGAAYLASPIDLGPGVVPVLGQLDDVAAVLLALRVALNGLDEDARARHLEAAGLTAADLDADLRTAGATAAWIVRRAGGLAAGGARIAAKGATAGVKRGVRLAGQALGAGAGTAGDLAARVRGLRSGGPPGRRAGPTRWG